MPALLPLRRGLLLSIPTTPPVVVLPRSFVLLVRQYTGGCRGRDAAAGTMLPTTTTRKRPFVAMTNGQSLSSSSPVAVPLARLRLSSSPSPSSRFRARKSPPRQEEHQNNIIRINVAAFDIRAAIDHGGRQERPFSSTVGGDNDENKNKSSSNSNAREQPAKAAGNNERASNATSGASLKMESDFASYLTGEQEGEDASSSSSSQQSIGSSSSSRRRKRARRRILYDTDHERRAKEILKKQIRKKERTRLKTAKNVYRALLGNVVICAAKLGAWASSGSSGMFAEFVHSVVDCGNQALLLVGLNESTTGADRKHPYGYGKSVYFWALVSALGTFFLGAGVSMTHAIGNVLNPSLQEVTWQVWGVLGLSFGVDGYVLYRTVSETMESKPDGVSVFKHLSNIRDPATLASTYYAWRFLRVWPAQRRSRLILYNFFVITHLFLSCTSSSTSPPRGRCRVLRCCFGLRRNRVVAHLHAAAFRRVRGRRYFGLAGRDGSRPRKNEPPVLARSGRRPRNNRRHRKDIVRLPEHRQHRLRSKPVDRSGNLLVQGRCRFRRVSSTLL